jgi:hypothetical protein
VQLGLFGGSAPVAPGKGNGSRVAFGRIEHNHWTGLAALDWGLLDRQLPAVLVEYFNLGLTLQATRGFAVINYLQAPYQGATGDLPGSIAGQFGKDTGRSSLDVNGPGGLFR